MQTIVFTLSALFFFGMGVYGLVAPRALVRPFDIELTSAAARAEVRAVYGGFGVALATLLAFAAADLYDLRRAAGMVVGVALAGMVFGRLVARAVEPASKFYPSWFFFAVESVGAAALLAASG